MKLVVKLSLAMHPKKKPVLPTIEKFPGQDSNFAAITSW